MNTNEVTTEKQTLSRGANHVPVGNIADKNQELAVNLSRILALFDLHEPTLKHVANEMQKVDEIATEILKRVNSAGFGLRHKVQHVEHAIALLGQNQTLLILNEQLLRTRSEDANASATE